MAQAPGHFRLIPPLLASLALTACAQHTELHRIEPILPTAVFLPLCIAALIVYKKGPSVVSLLAGLYCAILISFWIIFFYLYAIGRDSRALSRLLAEIFWQLWSPTSDSGLNFLIDACIVVLAVPVGIGILASGIVVICLLVVFLVLAALLQASPIIAGLILIGAFVWFGKRLRWFESSPDLWASDDRPPQSTSAPADSTGRPGHPPTGAYLASAAGAPQHEAAPPLQHSVNNNAAQNQVRRVEREIERLSVLGAFPPNPNSVFNLKHPEPPQSDTSSFRKKAKDIDNLLGKAPLPESDANRLRKLHFDISAGVRARERREHDSRDAESQRNRSDVLGIIRDARSWAEGAKTLKDLGEARSRLAKARELLTQTFLGQQAQECWDIWKEVKAHVNDRHESICENNYRALDAEIISLSPSIQYGDLRDAYEHLGQMRQRIRESDLTKDQRGWLHERLAQLSERATQRSRQERADRKEAKLQFYRRARENKQDQIDRLKGELAKLRILSYDERNPRRRDSLTRQIDDKERRIEQLDEAIKDIDRKIRRIREDLDD